VGKELHTVWGSNVQSQAYCVYALIATRLSSLVQMSVYLWCLNDNIITVNNVCFVIISDVVFASITNIKSFLSMRDMYMHCIQYSNGYILTYVC
jgi:hypothetical protein